MRTEDDLRTALTELEHHAPDAARVLPGGKPSSSHGLRSPRTVRWLAATATAAVAAGAVTALTVSRTPTTSSPNGGVAAAGSATNSTVQAKVLAAFTGTTGDVVYMSGYATGIGHSPVVTRYWFYPSLPAPGQLVRNRELEYSLSRTLDLSDQTSYVQSKQKATSPALSFSRGNRTIIDYAGKEFSQDKGTTLLESGDPRNPTSIVHDLTFEHTTVIKTTLNGRAALELSFKEPDDGDQQVHSLWVDASTYMPLRQTTTYGPDGKFESDTLNYEYLPPTPADLANLTAPVPAGFKQVSSLLLSGIGYVVTRGPLSSSSPQPSPPSSPKPSTSPAAQLSTSPAPQQSTR